MPQIGMTMELKSSSLKPSGLSPPESMSDPDEKEVSDDDDDDRNHKHRRRDTQSQSFEQDPLDQPLSQPYRKRNRTFENGQSDPQSHSNFERDSSKFDKRRVNFSSSGRGRGRNFQRDSRFGNIDVGPQMGHPGSVQPGLFSGRGLPNVSNPQCGPWNGFGLLPAIPNGALDAINPLGMSGIMRPQLNSSLNMGIQRQRCRDFEERGFCLRGDMCPMEHGVHRIVVDDVQSLSQFNLPASLSNPHVLATSAGSGFMPAGASPSPLLSSRALHSRTSKSIMDDDSLVGASHPSGADVYDPDQPLWNNNGHDMSAPLLGLQPLPFDESDPFVETDLSERVMFNSGVSNGSQSTSLSVWGRLNSKNKSEPKEKIDPKTKPSEYLESKSIEIHEPSGTSHLGKSYNGGTYNTKVVGSTSKVQDDAGANPRKPSQKAQRTLFVNHIPLKDNKRENLLSHFRKFGEVIDIYIPANSERAFVQFSKREEAEKALQAPDAVMGSRFIKLWWANRDNVPDGGTNTSNNVIMSQGGPSSSGSSHMTTKKENLRVATKVAVPKPSEGVLSVGNDLKSSAVNSPKAPPPAQKKTENLELLKEELRKKQEMLEQKRNEFRRQLDKLAKQATTVKGEVPVVQTSKKPKLDTSSTDVAKDENTKSEDAISPLKADILGETTVNMDKITSQRSKTSTAGGIRDHLNTKQPVRPMMGSFTTSFPMNRYKLDNRPTTFRINAPLPLGLANVGAIKEHFSTFGIISDVEIEDSGEESSPKNCSARVSFVTRISAERAFVNGKSWHGHTLQFSWLPSNIPTTSRSSGESSSALKGTVPNPEVQSQDKTEVSKSESILADKECISSPSKISHELSGDIQRDSNIEAQFSDQLTNYIPLEGDDQEIIDSEAQEEEDRAMDDEDSRGSMDFVDEKRVA